MENDIENEIKELVMARLEVMPSDKGISIGSKGEFTKDQLIEHVRMNDEIGKKITEIQMEYLRMLKDNIFYEQDFTDNAS